MGAAVGGIASGLGAYLGAGEFTETMDLVIPADATLGEHLMRAKTNWNNPVPDDACEETTYGETEEYTAIIDYPVGILDQALLMRT